MDYRQAPAIVTAALPDTLAKVIPTGDGFVLWWTDHVAGEWTETHSDLGIALARLAVLHHCVAHDTGFADPEPHDFSSSAATFLETSISPPYTTR
jgi:hypothetical protein